MKLDFGEKNLFQLIKEAITYLKHEGLIETIAHTLLILKRAIGIYVPVEDELEYLPYDSRYEDNQDFSERKTDVKPLAFFYHNFMKYQKMMHGGEKVLQNGSIQKKQYLSLKDIISREGLI